MARSGPAGGLMGHWRRVAAYEFANTDLAQAHPQQTRISTTDCCALATMSSKRGVALVRFG